MKTMNELDPTAQGHRSANSLIGSRRPLGWAILVCLLVPLSVAIPSGLPSRAEDKKAEELADRIVASYGGLAAIIYLRQKGQLRGIVKSYLEDGTTREGEIVIRFLHEMQKPEGLERMEIKFPDAPVLVIGYDGSRIWGTENGEPIVLRLRSEAAFKAALSHSYETLLRYREYKAEVKYVDRETKSGIEMDVLDLTLPGGAKIRYFISTRTFHILHMEYDVNIPGVDKPVRFRDSFYDFHAVQTTLVPFRVERYEDGKLVQEIRFNGIAYGVQVEESDFKPQANK